MLLNPRSQYPRRCPDRLLFTHPAVRISRHPPCSSDNLEALVLQTMHGNFHPTAPGHQSAPAALSASGVLSVSACGSTTPPLASSVARSLLPLPAHPHPLSAPLPASVQIAPGPSRNTSSGSTAEPSAGTLPASRGSNLFPHCGAADPSLLPLDTASRVSSSAGNSTPVSSPHRSTEASCSSPAPRLLRAEVPSCSSLSSSTGPPLEVTV